MQITEISIDELREANRLLTEDHAAGLITAIEKWTRLSYLHGLRIIEDDVEKKNPLARWR